MQTTPNTSVPFVPPKPKLFDITVRNVASVVSRSTGKPSARGSSSVMLAEPAMKPPRSISRQYRLVHAGRAERVARQRLGGRQRWHLAVEGLAHGFEFDDIAQRRRSAVGVEVVDRRVDAFHRHAHAAHRALA